MRTLLGHRRRVDQELVCLAATRAAAEAAEVEAEAEESKAPEAAVEHPGGARRYEREEEAEEAKAKAPHETSLSSRPVTFLDFAVDRRPRTQTASSYSLKPRVDSRPGSNLVQPPSLPPRIATATDAPAKREDS